MASKFNLGVSGVRFGNVVIARVHATLPDGCHAAEVTDIYPGGNIHYVVDPGEARIFIRFTRRPGPCPEIVREWEGVREIPDADHHELAAIAEYEGETFSVRARIHDFAPAPGADLDPGFNRAAAGRFIVIALIASNDTDRPLGCRVVSEHATYPMNYTQVFGPAARAVCEAWRTANCAGAGMEALVDGGSADAGG